MKSIKFKILFVSFLVISIPVALVFGIIFHSMYRDTLSLHEEAIRREIRQLDNAMTIFMEDAKQNTVQLAADPLLAKVDATLTSYVATTAKTKAVPRADDALGRDIMAFFKRVQASHPPYVEVYYGSEQGGFATSVETEEMPAGYDPRKRPWYREAMATPQRAAISPAYMSTTGEAVVGVAKVVLDGGKPTGCVGVDISLTVLTDIVKDIHIGKTGYVVFVQGDGVVISDPRNEKYNFKKITELNVPALAETFAKDGGTTEVDMGGKRYLALCHVAPRLGWKFLTFVEYDEIVGPLVGLMWQSGLGIAAALVLIGLVLTVFLKVEVFTPLARIIKHLRGIGEGHYDARLDPDRTDEIGQVYTALNQTSQTLADNMREIVAKSEEAERKAGQAEESRQRAEAATCLAETAKIDGMLHAADQLRGVVGIIATAAEDISTQIEESSQGAEQQSSRINETATAVEEMTASVLEIARNAESTARLAEDSKAAAQDGARQMELVRRDVQGIADGFRQVFDSVSELSTRADGIGSIAQTIEDIADQTNLLALNAAIEAARAGDAGRGFAVVADEVRKLAEKTMVATKEVGQAVSGIRHGVSGTLDGMGRTRQVIEASLTQTETAAQGLGTILDRFAESSDQVRAIATAAEQQSSATEEINRSIESINAISTETAEAMQEAAKAILELTTQVGVLRDLIASLEAGGRESQALVQGAARLPA